MARNPAPAGRLLCRPGRPARRRARRRPRRQPPRARQLAGQRALSYNKPQRTHDAAYELIAEFDRPAGRDHQARPIPAAPAVRGDNGRGPGFRALAFGTRSAPMGGIVRAETWPLRCRHRPRRSPQLFVEVVIAAVGRARGPRQRWPQSPNLAAAGGPAACPIPRGAPESCCASVGRRLPGGRDPRRPAGIRAGRFLSVVTQTAPAERCTSWPTCCSAFRVPPSMFKVETPSSMPRDGATVGIGAWPR